MPIFSKMSENDIPDLALNYVLREQLVDLVDAHLLAECLGTQVGYILVHGSHHTFEISYHGIAILLFLFRSHRVLHLALEKLGSLYIILQWQTQSQQGLMRCLPFVEWADEEKER